MLDEILSYKLTTDLQSRQSEKGVHGLCDVSGVQMVVVGHVLGGQVGRLYHAKIVDDFPRRQTQLCKQFALLITAKYL